MNCTVLIELLQLGDSRLVCLGVAEVQDCLRKGLTHFYEMSNLKVAILVCALCGSTEGALQCIRINDIELPKHNHSAACFFGLVNSKHARMECKVLTVLIEQPRKNLLLGGEVRHLNLANTVCNDWILLAYGNCLYGFDVTKNLGLWVVHTLHVWSQLILRTPVDE